jgi:site-specific recombinase XerD
VIGSPAIASQIRRVRGWVGVALAKAGVKERSFHSLRHYFITELVRRGVGLEAVRTLAGHSKLDMTQRYAHATADDLRAAIDKLAR